MKKQCIYRIECKDPEIKQIYIGSTNYLERRIGEHKSHCINPKSKNYNTPVYQFIREYGGWDNWKFDIEQDCFGMPKEDIVELEQIFIGCLNPELNSRNATGADIERYKEKNKEYKKINKESIKEYKKEYGKIKVNCPQCDKEMRKDSIYRHIKAIHPSI